MHIYKRLALFLGLAVIVACGGTGGGSSDVTAIKSTVTNFNPKTITAATTCNVGAGHIEFDGHALRHDQNDTPPVEFKMAGATHSGIFNFGDDTSVDYTMPCLTAGTWDVYYDSVKVGTITIT